MNKACGVCFDARIKVYGRNICRQCLLHSITRPSAVVPQLTAGMVGASMAFLTGLPWLAIFLASLTPLVDGGLVSWTLGNDCVGCGEPRPRAGCLPCYSAHGSFNCRSPWSQICCSLLEAPKTKTNPCWFPQGWSLAPLPGLQEAKCPGPRYGDFPLEHQQPGDPTRGHLQG